MKASPDQCKVKRKKESIFSQFFFSLKQKFLKKHPLDFPILADPQMEISEKYGVQNLPATFLIDRDKLVLGRAIGPREWKNQDLVDFFENRLRQNTN